MTDFLKTLNVVVFDPYEKPFVDSPKEDSETQAVLVEKMRQGKFQEVREHMKVIRALDLSMVDKSDFIIAYINPAVPTFGTVEEISWATRMRKPVFTVVEGGITETPLWVAAMMPEEQFFSSWDALKAHLRALDAGQIKMDNKYWRLLLEQYR